MSFASTQPESKIRPQATNEFLIQREDPKKKCSYVEDRLAQCSRSL